MANKGLSIVLLASLIMLTGCGHNAGPGTSVTSTTTPDTSTATKIMPDLNATSMIRGYGADAMEPLSIAKTLSSAAGGTWVVLAPKPLDDVNMGNPYSFTNNSQTVESILENIQKTNNPIAWDTSKGYMLLDFASKDDLARIEMQAPAQTVGIYLRGETDNAMLQGLATFEHIKIVADPGLLQQREAFREARHQKSDDDDDIQSPSSLLQESIQNVIPLSSIQQDYDIQFTLIEKADLDDIMSHLGQYYGGEFTNNGGTWQLKPLTDPVKIQAQISQIKQTIDQAGSSMSTPFTSFAERQHPTQQSSDAADQIEQQQLNTPLDPDVVDAFDTLGMFGSPAIPTLVSYLDVTKAPLAIASIQTLGAMTQPEALEAITTFQKTLETSMPAGQSEVARTAVKKAILQVLTSKSGGEANQLLAAAAFDQSSTADGRMSARMKLLKAGDIAPFETSSSSRTLSATTPSFTLEKASTAPDIAMYQSNQAPPDPNKASEIATYTAPDGTNWAVFISGYYGNAKDIWLADGKGGQWSEFLFTGQQFTFSQNFGGSMMTPNFGSCQLTVQGDNVTIAPPKRSQAAQLAAIQAKLQNPTLSPSDRAKLAQQYGTLSQTTMTLLGKTISLSLADLRKDTDHDGLPDLVENRLGTDPLKADTDGDGIADSTDANPLAAPVDNERSKLLQMVFTGLYGNDKSTTPIVVVLDKPYWQEFTGSNARVLCMTKDDYAKHYNDYSMFRLLEFGGPTDPGSTILSQDGPCLFNDSHTKAEVHFFFSNDMSSPQLAMLGFMGMQRGSGTSDYIATFSKSGDWTLNSIRKWKFDTATQALLGYMQQANGQQSGY